MEDDRRSKQPKEFIWKAKEDGKREYAKFVKEFTSTACKLRYILEPGGIESMMGNHPGPRPLSATRRKEWREDMREYEKRARKVPEDSTAALSLLENSFGYGTTPAHIIDKTIKTVLPYLTKKQWTYLRKFNACWEALRVEYQPSTSTDLKQLKEQISKLTDEGKGGFDGFRAEFHRLHAEITATGVQDAITARELNEIVRDGIKNKLIWMNICDRIYTADPNAPWEATFQAISNALTSYRQKDIDPYAEAMNGPTLGSTPLAASNATVPPQPMFNKRPPMFSDGRDRRPHKMFKPDRAVTPSERQPRESQTSDQLGTTSAPRLCTRCWRPGHSHKTCNSTECGCGSPLAPGQLICFGYDAHPATMRFRGRIPNFLSEALESHKRCSSANMAKSGGHKFQRQKLPWPKDKKRSISALAAQVIEELARRGFTDESEEEPT